MKIKCPECQSENLDQSTMIDVLCHNCNQIFGLYNKATHIIMIR